MTRINNRNEVNPEEDSYWKSQDGIYCFYLRGVGVGSLSGHHVAENPNGTITVTPSVLCTGHNEGKPTTRHGHITDGVWVESP